MKVIIIVTAIIIMELIIMPMVITAIWKYLSKENAPEPWDENSYS